MEGARYRMSWLAGYSVFSGTREEEWDADWKMSLYDDDAPELHYRRGGDTNEW